MNGDYRALIDTFGKGWEQGDVDAICSVFTEDAVFLETPFSSPDRGMAAIRAYWKDIPLYQAETDFSDRKSTRLNSSHSQISYAVFCLKKNKKPAYIK